MPLYVPLLHILISRCWPCHTCALHYAQRPVHLHGMVPE